MAPILYGVPASPPVRAVLLTAKAIGVNLEFKHIDMAKGENKTPEFLKINPQHTVPTLVDEDDFAIWDSHAISLYLISKYGKDDSLYPRDIKKRAIVDQRLFFDASVAFARLLNTVYGILLHGKKTITQEDIDSFSEVYEFLEAFLEGRQWIAGDSVTVADYSLIATVSSASSVFLKVDPSKFPRLASWLKRAEELPAYEANKQGLEEFRVKLTTALA